jgi:predicted acetyltransferase
LGTSCTRDALEARIGLEIGVLSQLLTVFFNNQFVCTNKIEEVEEFNF